MTNGGQEAPLTNEDDNAMESEDENLHKLAKEERPTSVFRVCSS